VPRDKNDIYMQERTYERLIERIKVSTEIPEGCGDDLLGYDRALREDSISLTRRIKCIQNLYTMATFLDKPFRECRRVDIAELVKRIEDHGYADHTIYDFKTILKKFYRWLRDSEDPPEEVKWIKPKKDKNNTLPEEILTEEELKSLIAHASNVRDKALISTLYESGCRIGEICSLQVKHVTFDQYGAQIVVTGKTGTRRVRLVYSTSYLATWISNHPDRGITPNPGCG
jgi:integrase